MFGHKMNPECFWMEKGEEISVVIGDDPRVFHLKGLPKLVFFAIASEQENPQLLAREKLPQVLADLRGLRLIVEA